MDFFLIDNSFLSYFSQNTNTQQSTISIQDKQIHLSNIKRATH
jgi:hypothetical protein